MPKSLGKVLPVIGGLIVVAAIAAAGVMYQKYQETKKKVDALSNPQEAARQETQKTIDAVGKLIELPSNETPTIATITDKDKLKEQAFFAKAENNDKVLIYPQAKKAILYRPSTNKVIEVGAVNITQQDQKTKQ